MKLRCPACGQDFSLDRAVLERDLEDLVQAAAKFGADWPLISEYLDAFRTRRDASLAAKKRLRLLREIWPVWEGGKFSLAGQWYTVGRPEFREALAVVNNRELTGLQNQNYLKAVLKGGAEKTSARRERELREKEERLRVGVREDKSPPTPLCQRGEKEEVEEDPAWRAEFQRLLKASLVQGLSPDEKTRRRAAYQAHLAKKGGA